MADCFAVDFEIAPKLRIVEFSRPGAHREVPPQDSVQGFFEVFLVSIASTYLAY